MPPKSAAKATSNSNSKTQALVKTGPKEIVAKKHRAQRDENGHRPTTAQALILRRSKYGPVGEGEVVASTKISGREKLDLLAGVFTLSPGRAPFTDRLFSSIRGPHNEIRLDHSHSVQFKESLEHRRGPIHRCVGFQ